MYSISSMQRLHVGLHSFLIAAQLGLFEHLFEGNDLSIYFEEHTSIVLQLPVVCEKKRKKVKFI